MYICMVHVVNTYGTFIRMVHAVWARVDSVKQMKTEGTGMPDPLPIQGCTQISVRAHKTGLSR